MPRIGDVVAGKYRIEKLLGQGGMGAVFEAHHEQLQQRVALKVMLSGLTGSPQLVSRFLNEARAAARIEGDHVARVLDLGQIDNGAPYIALELLVGSDLSRVIASRGPLPEGEAVGYVLEALEGLAQAHALGIVHRDLKPANLFLAQRRDGSAIVKVLDFGLSKVTNPLTGMSPNTRTATWSMMGTPHYTAPEQLESAKHVDARADIWSIGVILYELLSGQTPFHSDSFARLLVAILKDAPVPLRLVRPTVAPPLERAVMRCLSKDPGARFQNVHELADAIARYATLATHISNDSAPSMSGAPALQTRNAWTRSERCVAERQSRVPLVASIGVSAVVAMLLGGAAGLVFRGERTPVTAAASVSDGVASAIAPSLPATASAPSASAAPAPTPTAPSSTAGSARPPRPPAAPPPMASTSCHIVTTFDADGQPHFRKVCHPG